MSDKKQEQAIDSCPSRSPESSAENEPGQSAEDHSKPVELGGRDGPDPVRYGDWEKGGRCIDF